MKYFFLLLIIAAFVLSACGEPAECEVDTDCTAQGACFIAMCVEGSCDQVPKENCCGNLQCDDNENVCTCDKDCDFEGTDDGKCEGMVQIEEPRRPGKFYDAKYAQYYCGDDDCRIGVPDSLVEKVQYFTEHGRYAKFELISTVSEPYEIGGSGKLLANIRLAEVDAGRISLPITINRVQMLVGSQLIGDVASDLKFTSIGDSHDIVLPMNPVLEEVEDKSRVTARFNYEYGSINQRTEEVSVARAYFEKEYELFFIDPSKVSS